jgi:hypothetical protein
MTEFRILDDAVPGFDDDGDWNDVLRRAGRRRVRPAVIASVVVACAAVAVAPALGLLHHGGVRLPKEADRSNVAVVVAPVSRKVILQVAPWKGHQGFCYAVLFARSGCVARANGTVVTKPPLFGWTFDDRVRSGVATTFGGKQVRLTVTHFGGRIDATFFLVRDRLPRLLRSVVLRDAAGHVVARVNVR